ncbi:hypothetical protein A3Q56_03865 [Intoshia linei]|uniref:Uncharacterized protein n=1 Tax=Intoshia linei TaxID=1819745 RepID=A0A177B287_9BILA|nr:hypothetical protein A3Q56_03865 [Intoshia linei]
MTSGGADKLAKDTNNIVLAKIPLEPKLARLTDEGKFVNQNCESISEIFTKLCDVSLNLNKNKIINMKIVIQNSSRKIDLDIPRTLKEQKYKCYRKLVPKSKLPDVILHKNVLEKISLNNRLESIKKNHRRIMFDQNTATHIFKEECSKVEDLRRTVDLEHINNLQLPNIDKCNIKLPSSKCSSVSINTLSSKPIFYDDKKFFNYKTKRISNFLKSLTFITTPEIKKDSTGSCSLFHSYSDVQNSRYLSNKSTINYRINVMNAVNRFKQIIHLNKATHLDVDDCEPITIYTSPAYKMLKYSKICNNIPPKLPYYKPIDQCIKVYSVNNRFYKSVKLNDYSINRKKYRYYKKYCGMDRV